MPTTYLEIRGTVTECTPGPTPTCAKVVYQGVAPGLGNLIGDGSFNRQRRRWLKPYDPKTSAQLTRRARFAAGVAAWHALDAAGRAAWRALAAQRALPAYNAFLSAFLRA